jgi:hypothetical protein
VVPLLELMRQTPRKVHMELANRAKVDFPLIYCRAIHAAGCA